jgi:hypothetical protein
MESRLDYFLHPIYAVLSYPILSYLVLSFCSLFSLFQEKTRLITSKTPKDRDFLPVFKNFRKLKDKCKIFFAQSLDSCLKKQGYSLFCCPIIIYFWKIGQ